MLDGIMLLWFVLTAVSVLFVAIDIRNTPESPVLKWGFVLLTAYTGPIGAFLYVLGCREPLPGLHERYVAARWRQVLGSTMHCVAGDGVGILAGAMIAAWIGLGWAADVSLEYALGFGFGWTVFQALFMKDMAGGSYLRSLARTFMPEWLSMNALMAGMIPVMTIAMARLPGSEHPASPAFWFVMSMALLAGFVCAYPINGWLVARGIKHGMMTVRPGDTSPGAHVHDTMAADHAEPSPSGHGSGHVHGPGAPAQDSPAHERKVSPWAMTGMTLLSLAMLALGVFLALHFGHAMPA